VWERMTGNRKEREREREIKFIKPALPRVSGGILRKYW